MGGYIAMVKEQIDNYIIQPWEKVRFKQVGNVYEIMHMDSMNDKPTIKKISKKEYIQLSTGEVKEYKAKSNSRGDNMKNLKRSFKKLDDLIKANLTDIRRAKWITLTYRDNMQDTKKLYEDFEKFNKKLKRYVKKNFNNTKYEYIMVVEPQSRGAWHIHLILIFNRLAPYIHYKDIEYMWGNGFVSVGRVTSADKVADYLNKAKRSDKTKFELYPPKINVFRTSRKINKPKVQYITEIEAMKKVSQLNLELTHHLSFIIKDTANNFYNRISYRYYTYKIIHNK